MSITLKKMVKNSQFLYKMKLIAGIRNNTEEWLLNFTKGLNEAGASAFVVNLGPHTKDIPKEVIDYCNQVNMPLFTIPWETRMVDMTRDYCHSIMKNDYVEDNAATSIKNIIFETGDMEQQIHQLERYGFKRSGKYTFVCAAVDCFDVVDFDRIKKILSINGEKLAKKTRDLFIRFSHKNSLIFVLAEYTNQEVEGFVREFQKEAKSLNQKVYIGVSNNQIGLCNQVKNFEKAFLTMEMAVRRKDEVLFYDRLDIYKILFAINEKQILRNFYQDTIGKFEVYDKEGNTNLSEMLKIYLDNNGNVQIVSEQLFVHRNTVNNQMKKIEKITGKNPLELQDKLLLLMGYPFLIMLILTVLQLYAVI